MWVGTRLISASNEALTQAPDVGITALIGKLGLAWDAAWLHPENSARRVKTLSVGQVRQPIHTQSNGRWHAYSDALQPAIKKLCAAGLI